MDGFTEAYPDRVIDLHSHVLPGVDDGARTIEDSRALAIKAASEGITAIAATPHVRHDYPTTADRMEAEVARLRRDFAEQGIPVEILHGGEIDLEAMRQLPHDDLRRFTIAQSGRYLLVEFPYRGWPLDLEQTLFDLAMNGLAPILAHPERNAEVQAEPARLDPFVERGGLVQITAASLDGRLGRKSQRAAEELIEAGCVHCLASDAHLPEVREVGLAAAAKGLDEELAEYLTQTAPSAVVAGDGVPPPPARRRRRRFLRR
jgi:protein-tyrosine phosphatase